jgi:hypothetical protein
MTVDGRPETGGRRGIFSTVPPWRSGTRKQTETTEAWVVWRAKLSQVDEPDVPPEVRFRLPTLERT